MQKLSHIEVSEICQHLGENSPKSIKQVFGGDIHQSWKIEFKNSRFFIKRNVRKNKLLKFEEYCLNDLQKYVNSQSLVIPKVIFYIEVKNAELLVTEYIDMPNSNQKNLGKGLGEMHIASNGSNPKSFGYPIKGYIGTNEQPKGWENDWADCFINLRVGPQLEMLKNNFINTEIKKKIKLKIRSELIKHKPNISLVHGDLWSGNIGINQFNKGVIFDPACWWADSEVDIAMTKLFGGFGREFYDAYKTIVEIKPGFNKRIIIYNFYHILNHANMFGGSYLYQVQDYIQKIMNM